ncbi:bifunctional homocysteine S-methyltransferase/methylenetetrahydrofolate reductase [Ornithinibacillus sp. 4-3]|uniref:Bifunctional homocysteine S-methyltransferase/methylenetetrahydrofolate reductase n=1 Tax=Ornithinibacillus sp. 4-3 TaxID=3231488 RepID=A0AB39HM41_9BACI
MSLLDSLKERILIADGAMGTVLYSHGVKTCFEELNLTSAEQVQLVHEAYINAGAEVIQTNTYGANYIKLAQYGLEEKVKKINEAAVNLAKNASKGKAHILGTIGGIHGSQFEESEEEIKRSFKEQLYSLLLSGVDGILLETYYNFDELSIVLEIAREETNLPIIANVSMHEPGILENGLHLKDGLKRLEDIGADVVGVNCRLGPAQMVSSLESVPLLKHALLAAYPNASLPAYRDGVLYYENEPDYFATTANEFREQGVRLIGGCCGTTPQHIQKMAEGIKSRKPITEKKVIPIEEIIIKRQKKSDKKTISELAKERTTIIVELDSPKHLDVTEYIEGAKALKEAGADAITVADNSLASPRISNVAIASLLQKEGIKPLVHLTCRDRNLIGLQSHVLGLHTLGIDEMLVITGDPTKIGDFPGATSVFDVNSFKLIELIKKGNEGISFLGNSLREATNFSIAGAFNPNVANIEKAVQRMERKINSGADYILTQPIYHMEKFKQLSDATSHIDTPIFVGIMPITSSKNAEFLHHEVPGIKLSDEIRERMSNVAGDREASTKKSIAISKELIDEALKYFNGVYLITPFMRYDIIVELINYINEKKSKTQQIS